MRIFTWLLLLGGLASGTEAFEIERRQDQFESNTGYLVLPAPYSYPGIGDGWVLVGYAGNIFDTMTDAYALWITGDASGVIAEVDELFLVPQFFYLSYFSMDIRKFGRNFYQNRGMVTEKEDFSVAVGDLYINQEPSVTLTVWERRLELNYALRHQEGRTTEIRTPEGDLISSSVQTFESDSTKLSMLLDLTDDYNDPRSGLRLEQSREQFLSAKDTDSDYEVLTSNLTAYIPIGEESTWLFNYYQSAALVTRSGETDLDTLKTLLGLDYCASILLAAEQTACEEAITRDALNQQMANRNGTARALGGPDRLRSYPEERYQGAHSQSLGTEFRWNLRTGENLQDWVFLRDVFKVIQLAVFYEQGSVAETSTELGDHWRKSYGLGGRLVTGSGSVYRLDWATGNEGSELTVLFEYPWKN